MLFFWSKTFIWILALVSFKGKMLVFISEGLLLIKKRILLWFLSTYFRKILILIAMGEETSLINYFLWCFMLVLVIPGKIGLILDVRVLATAHVDVFVYEAEFIL